MADSIANAAGTGVTVTIRGKAYKVVPLSVRDVAEFESHVRSKRMKAAMPAVAEMERSERLDLLRILASTPPTSLEVTEEMQSIEGVAFLLWRSLRKTAPSLTLEQAGDLVDMNNVEEVSTVIQAVSGTDEGNPPAQGATGASGSGGTI